MSEMIFETLRGMLIGVPGVFAVLAVFFITLKILMKNNKEEEKED